MSLRTTVARTLLLLGLFMLASGPAMAQNIPTSCTTNGDGNWTFEVTEGPCAVDCDADHENADPFCVVGGQCTGVEYTVTLNYERKPDHVATTVPTCGIVYTAGQWYEACDGDPVTGIGAFECDEVAVRLNDRGSKAERFRLVVDGIKGTSLSSVVARAGRLTEACALAGLGDAPSLPSNVCVASCGPFAPKQTILFREIYEFEGCFVEFVRDLTTGDVLSATLTNDSPQTCDFTDDVIGDLEFFSDGVSLGLGQWGDGFISTGSNSCTCRLIAGRRYCWGSPCP